MIYDVYYGDGVWALGFVGNVPEKIKPIGTFEADDYDAASVKLKKFLRNRRLKIRHTSALAIPRKQNRG